MSPGFTYPSKAIGASLKDAPAARSIIHSPDFITVVFHLLLLCRDKAPGWPLTVNDRSNRLSSLRPALLLALGLHAAIEDNLLPCQHRHRAKLLQAPIIAD